MKQVSEPFAIAPDCAESLLPPNMYEYSFPERAFKNLGIYGLFLDACLIYLEGVVLLHRNGISSKDIKENGIELLQAYIAECWMRRGML